MEKGTHKQLFIRLQQKRQLKKLQRLNWIGLVSYHFRQISEEDKCAHAIIPSFKGDKKIHDKKKKKKKRQLNTEG